MRIVLAITIVSFVLHTVHSVSAPGQLFNLANWQLQEPVCTSNCGGAGVNQISGSSLKTYTSAYFYTNPADNSMTFWCPVNGVHTSGSDYPRSELREILNVPGNNDGSGDWTFIGSHQMDVTMKVLQEPTSRTITIGQVHGANIGSTHVAGACSIIIELEWSAGKIINHYRGPPPAGTNPLTAQCKALSQTLPGTYALGESFQYSLRVSGNQISVFTSKGGWTTPYAYSWWKTSGSSTYWMYFKAGDYVQSTGTSAKIGGKVSISALHTTHSSSSSTSSKAAAWTDYAVAAVDATNQGTNSAAPTTDNSVVIILSVTYGVIFVGLVAVIIAVLIPRSSYY